MAFVPMGFVVNLSPRAVFSAAIGPEMDGVTPMLVAMPADVRPADLAGLETDRGGPCHTLQSLQIVKEMAVLSHFAQEPRRQFVSGSGQ